MLRNSVAYERRYANRTRAKNAFNAAMRAGKIAKQPCFICGEKAEAHHASYDLPLGVTWLCKAHHEQVHHEALPSSPLR